ncbi:hypothetical protein [Aureimonas frigidaquae]|uniref:Uncharacterized protein n=1 Tax=Aureimonas frigidaquae TaxID=424757 RepID=A0A0P0Z404_9HYPH|nr:hypothetical protein [Aureimonas frigidaquae]BAT28786.1 hypothetical protein [Aureimonas frigidaquae]
MLILALSLAMVVTLLTATAITIHNEADKARVKASVRKHRVMY